MQTQDIEHIGEAEAFPKDSGVVMGLHPDTLKPMLSNGTEHILLVGPARSGKGVNTVIPTGLVWKDSAFFFDPKGELWANTAGFRKEHFHQRVLKFEPLCTDGSGARWNPLAEINYRSIEEFSDVSTVVSAMVKSDDEKKSGGDPFWDNSAVNLLNGVILHLMYKHHKEERPLPSPTDIMSFLSSPDKGTKDRFADMMTYPHIRPEEFLEEMHPVQELNDIKKEQYVNPLQQIYGNYYVPDMTAINEKLTELVSKRALKIAEENRSNNEHKSPRSAREIFQREIFSKKQTEEASKDILEKVFPQYVSHDKERRFKITAKTIPEIQSALRKAIQLGVPQIKSADDFGERDSFGRLGEPRIADAIDWYSRKVNEDDDSNTANENPVFYKLLVHPRVAEAAAKIYNGAEQTSLSIMQTAQTALGVYGDPVVQRNMCVSDFCIRDLLDPKQEISLYFVSQLMNFPKVRPIARLFTSTLLNKLVRGTQIDAGGTAKQAKKQRLLLMLDEFPQLGNMKSVELALAICAGFGLKMCLVCQSLNQLNDIYTKDNTIAANCRIHIYFTPNPDSSRITATTISKLLGTQRSDCHSTEFRVREVMTSDEVNCLFRSDKVVIFSAGQSLIFGNIFRCNILRYYLYPSFFDETNLPCPTISDTATQVLDYDTLFSIHADDREEMEKRSQIIREAKALRDGKPSLKKITGKTKTKKEIILPSNEDEIEEKKEGT